jgi:hypothetical protein
VLYFITSQSEHQDRRGLPRIVLLAVTPVSNPHSTVCLSGAATAVIGRHGPSLNYRRVMNFGSSLPAWLRGSASHPPSPPPPRQRKSNAHLPRSFLLINRFILIQISIPNTPWTYSTVIYLLLDLPSEPERLFHPLSIVESTSRDTKSVFSDVLSSLIATDRGGAYPAPFLQLLSPPSSPFVL